MLDSLSSRLPIKVKRAIKSRMGRPINRFDRSKLNAFCLEYNKSCRLVGRDEWVPAVFEFFYKGHSINDIVPDDDVPFVESWAPLNNNTEYLLYNFFQANYGIRDPIFYRFVVMDSFEVITYKNIVLESHAVRKFLSQEIYPECDSNNMTLLIQAFHPKISIPDNELRYFVLTKDTSSSYTAGVHSLPNRPQADPVALLGGRAFGSIAEKTISLSFNLSQPIKTVEKNNCSFYSVPNPVVSGGFFAQIDKSHAIRSLWHDGPRWSEAKKIDRSFARPLKTYVFLPPKFGCRLLLTPESLGFTPSQISITSFDLRHQLEQRVDLGAYEGTSLIDINKLLPSLDASIGRYLEVDFHTDAGAFENTPPAYAQVFYNTEENQNCDQVHSHTSSLGYFNSPRPLNKSYRCRKFAPLLNDAKSFIYYSIVGGGNEESSKLSIRIISDTGAEIKFSYKIDPAGITVIDSKELIKKLGENIKEAAIVQLESQTTNFNGSWYIVSEDNKALAVDHFTGG